MDEVFEGEGDIMAINGLKIDKNICNSNINDITLCYPFLKPNVMILYLKVYFLNMIKNFKLFI
jgi:hypothetical protein